MGNTIVKMCIVGARILVSRLLHAAALWIVHLQNVCRRAYEHGFIFCQLPAMILCVCVLMKKYACGFHLKLYTLFIENLVKFMVKCTTLVTVLCAIYSKFGEVYG